MTVPALSFLDVAKSYTDGDGRLAVLKGVELSVQPGERLAIVGRSGSGKSTILNLAGLLDRPDAGEIRIGGIETAGLSEAKRTTLRSRSIGFVFQNHHMLADFTLVENVMIGAAVGRGGGFGRANRVKALEWLDRVGLADRARFRPAHVSGGEQQRAAIARSLMPEPRVLLCDEPTGNLDIATGEEVAGWLWRISREAEMAMVIVTHDADLASRADRVYLLENGVLHQR